MSQSFEELRTRLHAVMKTYRIPISKDVPFLAEIIWVLGMQVEIKLVPLPAETLDAAPQSDS